VLVSHQRNASLFFPGKPPSSSKAARSPFPSLPRAVAGSQCARAPPATQARFAVLAQKLPGYFRQSGRGTGAFIRDAELRLSPQELGQILDDCTPTVLFQAQFSAR